MLSHVFAGCAIVVGAAIVRAQPLPTQSSGQAHSGVVSMTFPSFVFESGDLGGAAGVNNYAGEGMTIGAAASDYDNDGDTDLFVCNGWDVADQLWQNNGDGTFVDVASDVGLDLQGNSRCALWLDYDGDGRLDLVIARDDFDQDSWFGGINNYPPIVNNLRLFHQTTGGTFEDVTLSAGLGGYFSAVPRSTHAATLSAGDLNGDGYLDLFVGYWQSRLLLFMNNGDGTFTESGIAAGLNERTQMQIDFNMPHFWPWQAIMYDFNADGLLDIYVNQDFYPNLLWINQGEGTFVDEGTPWGVDNRMNDMGAVLGDYDNDGDFDLYITNIEREFMGVQQHNVLLRRNEGNTFTDVSDEAGVTSGRWGWGCVFFDPDLDTRLDLAATNGFNHSQWVTDESRFFENVGGSPVHFRNVTAAVGCDDRDWGSALMAFDADRDGDPDLLQMTKNEYPLGPMDSPVRLMRTERFGDAASHHWVVIQPRMSGLNRFAIGAVVKVTAGGLTQIRLITAGTSLQSQEPAEAHFGLGDSDTIDQVTVVWPGGTSETFTGVGADQVHVIDAGTGSGGLIAPTHPRVLAAFARDYVRGLRTADVNGDGTVDASDVTAAIGR